MRMWMALAGLALWALMAQSEAPARFDGLSWFGAFGWLQPAFAPAAADAPALAPVSSYREAAGHVPG